MAIPCLWPMPAPSPSLWICPHIHPYASPLVRSGLVCRHTNCSPVCLWDTGKLNSQFFPSLLLLSPLPGSVSISSAVADNRHLLPLNSHPPESLPPISSSVSVSVCPFFQPPRLRDIPISIPPPLSLLLSFDADKSEQRRTCFNAQLLFEVCRFSPERHHLNLLLIFVVVPDFSLPQTVLTVKVLPWLTRNDSQPNPNTWPPATSFDSVFCTSSVNSC